MFCLGKGRAPQRPTERSEIRAASFPTQTYRYPISTPHYLQLMTPPKPVRKGVSVAVITTVLTCQEVSLHPD